MGSPASSLSSATTGSPIPLAYGYVWVTGRRMQYYMLQNTGNSNLDYTRVGFWALGHGEWDGCTELWDSVLGRLLYQSEYDDPAHFHFHRGSTTALGTPLTPTSDGPDQNVDSFFQYLPSAINPLAYSLIAYYSLFLKLAINNQLNTHQNDPTQWTDMNPVGLWRAQRTRIFDANGNVTGYAFNTNPAWHFVDVLLRRKIFPESNINLFNGPDPLPAAAAARFDWESIFEAATYFDQLLANGRRRFQGNYVFNSQTTLNAVLETILLNCRSFSQEYAGKISLVCDKPRAVVFTFSRQHILPGTLQMDDQSVHTAGNRYITTFRDLLIPSAAKIASISCPDHSNPTVTTQLPHPFNAGDRVAIGGTSSIYDGEWAVKSVPTADSTGTDDIYTMVLYSKGSNYPTTLGSVGAMGLLYSRFKERAPEFRHKQNQYARGVVGLNIPRQRNRVKQQLDFATCTYDQVSRICNYELPKQLGLDQIPYVTPAAGTLTTHMFAKGPEGNPAIGLQPGDIIALDNTVDYQYTGSYEVLDTSIQPYTAQATSTGDSISLAPSSEGGTIQLTLGPYAPLFPDTSDPTQAGWQNVPDSDPGNDSNFTSVDLADGGLLAFFSGAQASGTTFQIPSVGFNPGNLLAWASPQGYQEYGHPMHGLTCSAATDTRKLLLQYEDGNGNLWPGDVNFAALSWRASSSESTQTINGITFTLFTLAGGEKVCFGQGLLYGDGTHSVQLPAGFTAAQTMATGLPADGYDPNNDAHGLECYLDSNLVAYLNYKDGEGHVWHGNVSVIVFGWLNNMGTMEVVGVSGGSWVTSLLSSGLTLAVGFQRLSDGGTYEAPTSAWPATSLQMIPSPRSFNNVDHPAHGIGACYVDGSYIAHMTYEDGEGNSWTGDLTAFGLLYDQAPAGSSGSSGGSGGGFDPGGQPGPSRPPIWGTPAPYFPGR